MRYAVFFLLMSLPLAAVDLVIDHVTVGGADLAKMQAQLNNVGMKSEYGGPHNNHATEMALMSFPDGSYLELIAIQPNADKAAVAAHYWSKEMTGNAGPTAWAIRSKDLAPDVEHMRGLGVQVASPVRAGRDRPDGVHLEWETANAGTEPNGTFLPFMIHDFTPREQRAFPSGKPTTTDFSGIGQVVVAVKDLEAATKRYRQAYELYRPVTASDKEFGAKLAIFRGTPVVLAQPTPGSWLAERIEKFGEGPCAFILKDADPGRILQATSKSHWYTEDVYWFEPSVLGFRLGFAPHRRGR